MPANGRWDLVRRLKGYVVLSTWTATRSEYRVDKLFWNLTQDRDGNMKVEYITETQHPVSVICLKIRSSAG